MFYGRTAAYDDALERSDRDGLTAALARNVRPDTGPWPEASQLADYVADACRQLAAQPSQSIVSGTAVFPLAKGGA